MFRFFITILLINTCYRSLGNPISTYTTVHPLARSLKALANRCENPLLVSQIKDRIQECDLIVPPFNSKEMQCLIFYDINNQLCDATGAPKLVLQHNFLTDLHKIIKVDLLCDNAQNWIFSNFTDFPLYKMTAEAVFGNHVQCQKVCDVSDLLSEDSNIFCKYYKWGSEVLKVLASTPSVQDNSTNSISPASTSEHLVNQDTKPSLPFTANNSIAPIAKSGNVNSNVEVKNPNPVIQTTLTNVERPSGEDVNKVNPSQTSSNVQISAIENQEAIKSSQPISNEIPNNIEQSAVAQKSDSPVKTEIEKTLLEEDELPPKKDDVEKEDQLLNNQLNDAKDSIADDVEDEQDSEEEDKQDLQDDSEISIGKTLIQEDKNKENEKSKNVPLLTSFTVEKSQGEFISKIPQDEFPEADDHFFSFFLTAVIIVVLLYILYHNKSKFSKVILGLIVEGRQSGRRRNSRGHAYRRLDTLEQAMSTNATAPPSKIIY